MSERKIAGETPVLPNRRRHAFFFFFFFFFFVSHQDEIEIRASCFVRNSGYWILARSDLKL